MSAIYEKTCLGCEAAIHVYLRESLYCGKCKEEKSKEYVKLLLCIKEKERVEREKKNLQKLYELNPQLKGAQKQNQK